MARSTDFDDHWLERARSADPPALDSLLERVLPGLRTFVRLRISPALRAKESSSDLVQSVCTDLLRNIGKVDFDGEAPFRAWLYTAALNKIREHEKYFQREKRCVAREVRLGGDATADPGPPGIGAPGPTPSQHAMAREQAEQLERAFDVLPEDYREVLCLSRLLGLSHREVAARMGRSEIAVRTLLSRAMARLSAVLVREEPAD